MGKFVQTLEKRGKLDDPAQWADDECVRQPAFNLEAFQKRINKIVGLTTEKKEIIRIRWAWHPDCYSEFYTKWDAAGVPLASEVRAKYRLTTIHIDSEHSVDICPPRFVIEERLESAQYYDAWEKNRWQTDPLTGKNVCYRPPAPRDGYYTFVRYVAMHDPFKQCCNAAAQAGEECFGTFRKPSEVDLLALSRWKRTIERQKFRPNPYKPLSPQDFARVQAETEAAQRDRVRAEESLKAEREKFYREILKPSAAFSLPSGTHEKRTEAGLILPS